MKLLQNAKEIAQVLQLASVLQEFKLNYKIITPYEEQRHTIQTEMQKEELEWGDKCFNVDAFQGIYFLFLSISI
jgi:superfamily I DNA and/or RNA helicase